MITTIFRVIKYGFHGFWRNGLLSAATILVMVLALIVFQGLMVFGVISKTAVASLQDKIDISVYFKTDAAEDEVLKIERSLKTLAEVKAVEYISRDKALEIFKSRHKEDETISKALSELNDNPLSASLNVKANDPTEYSVIASYLENDNFKSVIDKVTYSQNQLAINRLVKIADTADKVGLAVIIALALIALIVTFNTVRLAIYSNREEIGIMRLVGSSNMFIRGPYLVEGILYGVISAIFAVGLVAPAVYAASPYVSVFIPEMNLLNYFTGNLLNLLGYTVLLGVALGTLSSSVAIGRYLKV